MCFLHVGSLLPRSECKLVVRDTARVSLNSARAHQTGFGVLREHYDWIDCQSNKAPTIRNEMHHRFTTKERGNMNPRIEEGKPRGGPFEGLRQARKHPTRP